MITIKNDKVMNIQGAIRGMRNPLQSWDKSDSKGCNMHGYSIGEKDLKLAQSLCRAGSDHRKFMRQIIVSVDITAPLYLWKEFDTYKVGTVANSTSTMHTIHQKPFGLEDFSIDGMTKESIAMMLDIVDYIEECRLAYLLAKEKKDWNDIIKLLPMSYNQLRTITLNYETLLNIYHSRKNHKLSEWHTLCAWIERLPYAQELICNIMKEEGE